MELMERIKRFEEARGLYPHLRQYLEDSVKKGNKMPEFYVNLENAMGTLEEFSIVYPLPDSYFIHAYKSWSGGKKYVIVEPPMDPDAYAKYPTVAEAFSKECGDLVRKAKGDEKDDVVMDFMIRMVTGHKEPSPGWLAKKMGRGPPPKIQINPKELMPIWQRLCRDMIDHGALTPVIDDPYVDEIESAGSGRLTVLHRIWGMMESSLRFKDALELDTLLEKELSHPGRGWAAFKTVSFKTSRGATGIIQR
jgi:hypothetical protein